MTALLFALLGGQSYTPQRIPLEGEWRLTQSSRHLNLTAKVPGEVHADLLRAHQIPDPYLRDNDRNVQWVGEVPWTYSRTFQVDRVFLRHPHQILRCEGLDTLATIHINGQEVAHADNMFRTWEFDVRPYLRAGKNAIQIDFDPIEPFLKAHETQAAFPGKPVQTHGWGYVRKPPYQQGWDFSPKLITAGIEHPIALLGWDQSRLTDAQIDQDHFHPGQVTLTVRTATDDAGADQRPNVSNSVQLAEGSRLRCFSTALTKTLRRIRPKTKKLARQEAKNCLAPDAPSRPTTSQTCPSPSAAGETVRITVEFQGREVAHADTPVQANRTTTKVTLKNPHLWWPNGLGPQNLYTVRIELKDHDGHTRDRLRKRIGLRTITWTPKTDQHPLSIAVNGRPFFAKGSNWVPRDALMRTTPAEERRTVQLAVDAHMNLMRLWGGGFYETDSFFDVCDEKGLLVWFEFKFADATYPSFDPQWLANVRQEAVDNVRRVRHHPAIAVYSGNNEVIGFIADKTDAGHMSRDDYDLLFHTTLRDVVHALAPSAFYTPGSPEIGDDHYWDVWHGSATFASYRDRHGFMSEYGFQAFPSPRSVDVFTAPSDRQTVESPVMLNHQRNWRDGNALIVSTMLRSYRRPKDFDSTLWLSQIQQADGILTGVEHWRRDWPRSTGSLVWQFDDCWPSVSWSMIDWYGHPKALYYALRRAYSPVAVSAIADEKTKVATLYVVDDRSSKGKGQIDWQLISPDGKIERRGHAIAEPGRIKATEVDFTTSPGALLFATLHVAGQPDSTTVAYLGRPKDLELQDPGIKTKIAKQGDAYRITLTATKPTPCVWLDIDADLSDNFFPLAPGHPVTVFARAVHRIEVLKVRSLYDTYAPGTPPNPITKPDPDGKIRLTAENAEILGNTAILEPGPPANIGNWQDPDDRLQWTVQAPKPGRYQATATVSIPANEAGSTFEVTLNDQHLTGAVPATNGWTDYVSIPLGNLTITQAKSIRIYLKPTHKASTHVMNLRAVTLTPRS